MTLVFRLRLVMSSLVKSNRQIKICQLKFLPIFLAIWYRSQDDRVKYQPFFVVAVPERMFNFKCRIYRGIVFKLQDSCYHFSLDCHPPIPCLRRPKSSWELFAKVPGIFGKVPGNRCMSQKVARTLGTQRFLKPLQRFPRTLGTSWT